MNGRASRRRWLTDCMPSRHDLGCLYRSRRKCAIARSAECHSARPASVC